MKLASRRPYGPILPLLCLLLFGQGACRPASSTSEEPKAATTSAAKAKATAKPTDSAGTKHSAARRIPAGKAKSPRLALGANGAVASAEAHATDIGIAILKQGGNAVDAAIAVAFALAVTHPSAGNLGGGGFMIVHTRGGKEAALDYREEAPGAATRDMYLDEQGNPTRESLLGPKAAGIPGTVAGMALAHQRFGTLPWRTLLDPAITLADQGHRLDSFHADDLRRAVLRMQAAGFESSARHYLRPDGKAFKEGDLWKQPQLGETLRILRDRGPRAFYEGPLAQTMARHVRAAGGIWTAADLKTYRARWRKPVAFDYRGHRIVTMPPPSAGGVVLRQILGASEHLSLEKLPWQSPKAVHLYVEAARRAYADRNTLLGDPDFVKMPLERLLSKSYIAERMDGIDPKRATPSSAVRAGVAPKRQSEQTTHFSVVDAQGNAVSNTYTLNTGFGSKFVIPTVGVLLNNEMDDFAVKPGHPNAYGLVQSEQNRIEPRKRMLSSMTPTIIVKDGAVRAAIGSPGGSTITTTVAQITMALIDHGRNIDEAVSAGRIHHQWLPDKVFVETHVPTALNDALEERGHSVSVRRWSIGHANCIEVEPESRGFRAVADTTRDGGKAAAY